MGEISLLFLLVLLKRIPASCEDGGFIVEGLISFLIVDPGGLERILNKIIPLVVFK